MRRGKEKRKKDNKKKWQKKVKSSAEEPQGGVKAKKAANMKPKTTK